MFLFLQELPRRRKQDVLQQLKRIPKERTDVDNTNSTRKDVEENDSDSLSGNNSSQGGLNVNKVSSLLKLLLGLKKESRERRSSDGRFF